MKNSEFLLAVVFLGIFNFLGCDARALVLAPIFQDGAVLQRDMPVPVWGMAEPRAEVSVSFSGQKVTTVAGEDGAWTVFLDPLKASSESQQLVVSSAGKDVTLKEVVVGEVWLASGQSNMQWPLAKTLEAAKVIAAANTPLVREFNTKDTFADEPQKRVEGSWRAATHEFVGSFSGVAYYFATRLHEELGVPIGIIKSSVGGTQVEAWMPREGLDATTLSSRVRERWQGDMEQLPMRLEQFERNLAEWEKRKAKAEEEGKNFTQNRPRRPNPEHQRPSGLFNGMVAPHVPAALRGFIWYQGEANTSRSEEYRELSGGLISSWRKVFGNEEAPFYFVQLANFDPQADSTGMSWASLRQAQSEVLDVPNTGMAVSIDVGESKDIHPQNKKDVGHRLAGLALRRTYGREDVSDSGPVFVGARREGSAVLVDFVKQSELVLREGQNSGFELAGKDGIFHAAEAAIVDGVIRLQCDKVQEPELVRYAWANDPAVSLFDKNGLPAAPFRADVK